MYDKMLQALQLDPGLKLQRQRSQEFDQSTSEQHVSEVDAVQK